jgi:hypothetical protein
LRIESERFVEEDTERNPPGSMQEGIGRGRLAIFPARKQDGRAISK